MTFDRRVQTLTLVYEYLFQGLSLVLDVNRELDLRRRAKQIHAVKLFLGWILASAKKTKQSLVRALGNKNNTETRRHPRNFRTMENNRDTKETATRKRINKTKRSHDATKGSDGQKGWTKSGARRAFREDDIRSGRFLIVKFPSTVLR